MQDMDAKEPKTTVSPDGMKSSGKKMVREKKVDLQRKLEKEKRDKKRKDKSKKKTGVNGFFRPYL